MTVLTSEHTNQRALADVHAAYDTCTHMCDIWRDVFSEKDTRAGENERERNVSVYDPGRNNRGAWKWLPRTSFVRHFILLKINRACPSARMTTNAAYKCH